MDLQINLLPRYLTNWGIIHGFIAFFKVEVMGYSAISLKGIPYPFHLRKGSSDRLVFHEVFLFNGYDIKVPDPKVIVDGGANIGLTSIYFANKFKNATIISIEPSGSNFHLLEKNTKNYSSIIPVHSALWNRDAYLKIKSNDEAAWAFSVEECDPKHSEAFPAISLSSLMKQKGIAYIDVLKLDVEGSERELFFDNYDYWIRRTKCILVELHDWSKKDASKQVFKTISQYNFTTLTLNGMLQFTNVDIP
ncbi:MAG TPA: FkbM family methyltransferase [Cyclobacteriaceae bacterium]|jgi:FkbM family methyltransferase|nr:FkbM family methyltransferase [Cyclobacteriaceae bacterium]